MTDAQYTLLNAAAALSMRGDGTSDVELIVHGAPFRIAAIHHYQHDGALVEAQLADGSSLCFDVDALTGYRVVPKN